MAKQDDRDKKKSPPQDNNTVRPPKVTPRLVKEVPKGYREEIRDGRRVFVKTESTPNSIEPAYPQPVKPTPTKTTPKIVSGIPKKILPPKPKQNLPTETPPSVKEDVVYLEDTVKPPIGLYGDVDAYRKVLPKAYAGQPWEDIVYPDETGNYSNKAVTVRTFQGKPIESDVASQFDAQGNFVPKYTGQDLDAARPFRIMQPKDSGVNQQNMAESSLLMPGTTINKQTGGGGSPVSDVKTVHGLDTQYNLKKYDASGKEIPSGITPVNGTFSIPKFAKGGLVRKIKGYYTGGPVNPYQQTNYETYGDNPQAISGQGIIQQSGSVEFTPAGNVQYSQQPNVGMTSSSGNSKKVKTQEQLQKEKETRANVASGVGALGNTLNANDTSTQGVVAKGLTSSGVPVLTAIGGAYGIINSVAEPQKKKAEKIEVVNGKAQLVDEKKARNTSIVGGILSGSKALQARSSYKGGYTDITGKGYAKHLEEEAQKQIEAVKDINTSARISDAMAARNRGESDVRQADLINMNNLEFDENGNLITPERSYRKGGVVGKVKQMCADGGVIKGKGGPKDDKVNAKVKEGSFIVPAENAHIAEELRKKVLGKPPKAKANLNEKGGEQVKLSNGEHKFTPEEKNKLIQKGIDVNKLAPNAEQKEYMQFPKIMGLKEGGEVDGVDPAKELAKIEAEKKAIKDIENKKEVDRTIAEKERLKKFVIDTKLKDRQDKIKSWESKAKDSKTKLDALTKAYEDMTKEFDSSSLSKTDKLVGVEGTKNKEYQRNQKEKLLKDIQKAESEYKNSKQTYDYVKNDSNYTPEGLSKIEASKGIKAPKLPSNVKKEDVVVSPKTEIKTATISPKTSGKLVTSKSVYTPPSVEQKTEDEVVVPAANKPSIIGANEAKNAKALSDTAYAADTMNNPALKTAPSQRRGVSGLLRNIDPTALIGPAQTYLGVKMLKGEKRPEYNPQLDPAFNASVEGALRESQYGLSPEERFAAQQNIQNAMNDARFSARNFAGGSAGNAFTQERAAINSGLANKLNMQIADQQLRREKQQYANQLVANRAAINAQNKQDVFNIANQAFNQRQQAGSELVGAGLANTIGAYRYNRNQNMINDINQQSNPWTNYNPSV